jgi:hypothetical protein
MKSSSGINIGNGNNCQENRKTSAASFSSSAYINKRVTKTNTVLTKSSNFEEEDHVKRQDQQLNDFIQPAHSSFTNSISSFQSDSVSSKFKFEITPETINHLNQHQTDTRRRSRIQWITSHGSFNSKPKISSAHASMILSGSSMDLNTTKMANNIKKEILNIPNVSITELTPKDFDDEYQRFVEQDYQQSHNQDDFDQTLKCTSIIVDAGDDNGIDDNEKDKVFVDQASQAVITELKSKKKVKSANHYKKIKSATAKRPKQPSATQVSQQVVQATLSSSPTRTTVQGDLTVGTVTKLATLTTKVDDNNAGKNTITVDITKARSNLEVVRLCIRELGWKEVIK